MSVIGVLRAESCQSFAGRTAVHACDNPIKQTAFTLKEQPRSGPPPVYFDQRKQSSTRSVGMTLARPPKAGIERKCIWICVASATTDPSTVADATKNWGWHLIPALRGRAKFNRRSGDEAYRDQIFLVC